MTTYFVRISIEAGSLIDEFAALLKEFDELFSRHVLLRASVKSGVFPEVLYDGITKRRFIKRPVAANHHFHDFMAVDLVLCMHVRNLMFISTSLPESNFHGRYRNSKAE